VLKGLLRKFGVVRIDYENDWFALLTIGPRLTNILLRECVMILEFWIGRRSIMRSSICASV